MTRKSPYLVQRRNTFEGLSRRKPFIGTRILYTLFRELCLELEAPRYLLGCTAVLGTYAFDPLSLL